MIFFSLGTKVICTILLCLVLMITLNTPKAMAQTAPVTPAQIPDSCDPDYMDVLNARSYVEAKREMETAQRIIVKPDSVLEYSCFHEEYLQFANWVNTFSGYGVRSAGNPPEFDGTPPPVRVMPVSLSNSLDLVVYDSLVGFLDSFSHTYGGGAYPIFPNPAAGCNSMNIVWFTSKCQNFDPNWWVRFEDLASTDIRVFPIPCLPTYDTDRTTNLNAAIPASYPSPALPAANGGMDRLDAHLPWVTGACTSPLQTGLSVTLRGGTVVQDAVCVQPKCYFDGSTCTN